MATAQQLARPGPGLYDQDFYVWTNGEKGPPGTCEPLDLDLHVFGKMAMAARKTLTELAIHHQRAAPTINA
ncbi:hypothetical protein [Acidithiobacillus sp.]